MVSLKCVALAILLQLFLTVSECRADQSDRDDLMDFDFVKEVKSAPNDTEIGATEKYPFNSAFDDFIDIIVEPSEQGSHIQEKETKVKNKLARAWKNPNMQRKFAEVLPILKVMTSEQKIALAALVSAQVGAKQGRELNIDQVRRRENLFSMYIICLMFRQQSCEKSCV